MAEPTLIEKLDAQLDDLLRRDVWPLMVQLDRLREDRYNPAVRALHASQESAARFNGAGRAVYPALRHNVAFGSLEEFMVDVLRRLRSGALDPAPK